MGGMHIPAKRAWTVLLSWVAEEAFFNLMGVRDMIPEIVRAFVPIIGATAATMAVWCLIDLLRDWDKNHAKKVVSELESLVSSGRLVFSGVREGEIPKEDFYWFIVITGKYRNWPLQIKDRHSGADIRGAIDRAEYYAQVFRTYGYLRGRCRVFRDKWCGAKTRRAKR